MVFYFALCALIFSKALDMIDFSWPSSGLRPLSIFQLNLEMRQRTLI